MTRQSFAVLYRWKIDPAYEDMFRQKWKASTIALREHHGAMGSCLSRDDQGNFFAFARWPSEDHRNNAFAELPPVEPTPGILEFQETKLWVEEDLLLR